MTFEECDEKRNTFQVERAAVFVKDFPQHVLDLMDACLKGQNAHLGKHANRRSLDQNRRGPRARKLQGMRPGRKYRAPKFQTKHHLYWLLSS